MSPEELEEAKNCWDTLRCLIAKDGSEGLAEQFEQAVKLFGLDLVMPLIEDQDVYKNAQPEVKEMMVKGLKYLEWISKVN